MKSNLSVWTLSYTKRYYLTHPWRFFQEVFQNIQAAYRRARYGWCGRDVWDFDHWMSKIIPPMLRHMADEGSGYPGIAPFETPEKWSDWLHSMADAFDTIDDEEYWTETKNEYYKEWRALCDYRNSRHPNLTMTCEYDTSEERWKELNRKYWDRLHELSAERQAYIDGTFKTFATHFSSLWD